MDTQDNILSQIFEGDDDEFYDEKEVEKDKLKEKEKGLEQEQEHEHEHEQHPSLSQQEQQQSSNQHNIKDDVEKHDDQPINGENFKRKISPKNGFQYKSTYPYTKRGHQRNLRYFDGSPKRYDERSNHHERPHDKYYGGSYTEKLYNEKPYTERPYSERSYQEKALEKLFQDNTKLFEYVDRLSQDNIKLFEYVKQSLDSITDCLKVIAESEVQRKIEKKQNDEITKPILVKNDTIVNEQQKNETRKELENKMLQDAALILEEEERLEKEKQEELEKKKQEERDKSMLVKNVVDESTKELLSRSTKRKIENKEQEGGSQAKKQKVTTNTKPINLEESSVKGLTRIENIPQAQNLNPNILKGFHYAFFDYQDQRLFSLNHLFKIKENTLPTVEEIKLIFVKSNFIKNSLLIDDLILMPITELQLLIQSKSFPGFVNKIVKMVYGNLPLDTQQVITQNLMEFYNTFL